MEKKPRLRAPNFTTSDNLLLCDIVAKYKHVIENKKTDGANLQQKQKAWFEVMKEFNSITSGCTRTMESLQQTYKNLKKKAKKNASDKKMEIPVDKETLILNIEECGTSSKSCDWDKVAENTGASKEMCQEMFADLKRKAAAKDRILKKKIMGTGGGPPPHDDNDPVLEKVKALVGPSMDGLFTMYDGDSPIMVSQNVPPIEIENIESSSQEFTIKNDANQPQMTQDANLLNSSTTIHDESYFTNDRANLKRKPHQLLTTKRKMEKEKKQTVSEKFSSLALEKMELVYLQKELLQIQIKEEKDKAEHNKILRAMELEELKKKYAHNEVIRKLEIETFK